MKQLDKLASSIRQYDSRSSDRIIALSNKWQSNKTILILVHPDCAIELNRSESEAYLKKIQRVQPGLYDKIFTLFMFSENFKTTGWIDHPNFDIFLKIRNHLENVSDFSHDTSKGKQAFNGPVGDYLMENENVDIFLAGGYQDLCLKNNYESFCSVLNWVVEQQHHEVIIEKQLVFYRNTVWDKDKYTAQPDDPWWNDLEIFDAPFDENEDEDEEKP